MSPVPKESPRRDTDDVTMMSCERLCQCSQLFQYLRRDRQGNNFIVDDYLKGKILRNLMLLEAQTPAGYQWIDQNTPKDSRVMAWWDYGPSHEASMKGPDGKTHGRSRGYQITGIARRTSIADGPCPGGFLPRRL